MLGMEAGTVVDGGALEVDVVLLAAEVVGGGVLLAAGVVGGGVLATAAIVVAGMVLGRGVDAWGVVLAAPRKRSQSYTSQLA